MSSGKALTSALSESVSSLALIGTRLQSLQSHDALLVLRHSFSTPCLQHLLRGMLCTGHPLLSDYDSSLRSILTSITNTTLSDSAWCQASLPIGLGGLGVRKAVDLASSCFLSSAHGAEALVSAILGGVSILSHDPLVQVALQDWKLRAGGVDTTTPSGSLHMQKAWDTPIATHLFQALVSDAPDEYSKARLQASSAPHAGDWLKVVPVSALGLRLDDEGLRIAVGLRLGSNICSPFTCGCGSKVDARGSHSLSCLRGAGRHLRHNLVNEVVLRAFSRANIPASREPSGLIPGTSLRPDGVTVIPWSEGRYVAWDVTCPDTVAPSHIQQSAGAAGATAEHAALLKKQKYAQLPAAYFFLPIAIETLGALSSEALEFLNVLGGRAIAINGDPRERSFLFQRLSMAVQRGNIACFTNSLHQDLFLPDPDHF